MVWPGLQSLTWCPLQINTSQIKVDKVQIIGSTSCPFAVCLDQDERKILQSVVRWEKGPHFPLAKVVPGKGPVSMLLPEAWRDLSLPCPALQVRSITLLQAREEWPAAPEALRSASAGWVRPVLPSLPPHHDFQWSSALTSGHQAGQESTQLLDHSPEQPHSVEN